MKCSYCKNDVGVVAQRVESHTYLFINYTFDNDSFHEYRPCPMGNQLVLGKTKVIKLEQLELDL